MTEIALTKIDVLRNLPVLKICVDYRYKGQRIEYPPQGENALAEVEPIYEEMPGFSEDISTCKHFDGLPYNVQKYIQRLEALTQVRISYVSVFLTSPALYHSCPGQGFFVCFFSEAFPCRYFPLSRTKALTA